ncbi:outer membrane biogenesis protein BamB [Stieleria neptunia]|uniref:Outer membrane biogenesis protein BamB n=1 Tax=Stieleria neptunia TaxID=2527979 RepID=A0A518HWD1_9BACT|nr:PQQ-binding-like beta-propeller repeat protein [Stieleria neptunia]QDV45133.1 outer membrane biogenesis protein BamB [Stieleria neptunia]
MTSMPLYRFSVHGLFVVVFLASFSQCIAEDWYRWRGPSGDGISRETDWKCDWTDGQAEIAWSRSVGTGFSSVVVKDGRAFTLGHVDGQDIVYCINVADGQTVWTFGYPAELDDRDFEGGPISTPTVDGDRLYVMGRAGELFCLQISDGTKLWGKNIADETEVRLPGWGFSAAPLVIGDTLLLNVGESGVAVDKHSGDLLWSSDDRECGYASPVLIPNSEPTAAVIASGKAYVGVDVQSGEQLWAERWLTSFNCNAADPIFHDGKMFLSSGYNRGSALFDISGETPDLIWKSKEMKNQIHTSILYQGHLYGIDGDMETGARLRCMDWSTGDIRWSVDDLRPGGLAMADGKLLLLTEPGDLIIAPATRDGWEPIARSKVLDGKTWTSPVLSGGRIFCRSIRGQLVCVDCRD